MYFFYTGAGDGSGDDIVESLRKFASLESHNPLLTIIDIPDQQIYAYNTKDDGNESAVNEQVIRKFVEDYFDKKLEGKKLRAS